MLTEAQEKNIAHYMRNHAEKYVVCGSVMCTELAEDAAGAFFLDGRGEPPDLFDRLCEIALEVAQDYEQSQSYQGYEH